MFFSNLTVAAHSSALVQVRASLLASLCSVVACGGGGEPVGDAGDIVLQADGAPQLRDAGFDGNFAPDAAAVDGGQPRDASVGLDAGVGADSGSRDAGSDSGNTGGPITCSAPGTYKNNGVGCGVERWPIKVGSDPAAPSVKLVPVPTSIAALVAIPAAGGGVSRSAPVEDTLYELRDVKMSLIKFETDSDYHIVVTDGPHTMIVEVPFPGCVVSPSPWQCFVSRVRGEVDAQFVVTPTPQYPNVTVSLRGLGFFDPIHGQTGVAPNGIELHPVLELCFGAGCVLP